jgi:hypothetical protein
MLDLLLFKCVRRFGVEIKRIDAPSLTGSMRIALANLQLATLRCVAIFGRLCSLLIRKQPVVFFLDHRIALASAFLQSPAV